MVLCPLSWASGVDLRRPCSRSLVLLVILVVIHQYVPSCNVYIMCPLMRDTVQHRLSMVPMDLEHAVAMTPSIDHFQSQPLLVPVHVIHPCDHRANWVGQTIKIHPSWYIANMVQRSNLKLYTTVVTYPLNPSLPTNHAGSGRVHH